MARRACSQAASRGPPGGQVEPRSVFSADELSTHQQNLLAQGLESGVLKLWRQTEALELPEACRRWAV
jgi:hypothetical protein